MAPPSSSSSSGGGSGGPSSSSSSSRFSSLPLPTALINPHRIRSYILRLPLFTRITILAVLVFWVLELQSAWSVVQWGALIPSEIGFGTMYRMNTYPLIHLGFLHMVLDLVCVVPLLERFEAEFGTLTSLALFLGPFGTIPGGLYLLFDKVILRDNTTICGLSIWVFLLLGAESIKTYRSNPYFDIASHRVPTWITPLVLIVITSVLISGSSFLGHMSGVLVGYLWGLGYIRFLAPPEKVLRWIEGKLNLLGRLPHYVSVDQKTYGRYGVLPTTSNDGPSSHSVPIGMGWVGGGGQRLGP